MSYRERGQESEKSKEQIVAEIRAEEIMKKANWSLKAKLSPTRYRLMQTFIVEYSDDILLSLIEVTTKLEGHDEIQYLRGIISFISGQNTDKSIRLLVEPYEKSYKIDTSSRYTKLKEPFQEAKKYLQINSYFINHHSKEAILGYQNLQGEHRFKDLPLQK